MCGNGIVNIQIFFYGAHKILADNLIFGQWTSLSAGKPYFDQ